MLDKDPSESLTTSEWLHTKQGRRAIRTSILPALERAGIVPEGSALAYREPNPLATFFRRLLASRRHRQAWWSDEVAAPDDEAPHSNASSYGHTTSAMLPQAYMSGHSYGDTPKG